MPRGSGAPASAPPMSFIRKGTPRNGPSRQIGAAARARARSSAGWMTAFSRGFRRSRRAMAASTSSRGDDVAAAHELGLGGGVERGEFVGHATWSSTDRIRRG